MITKWIAAGIAGCLALVGAVALATAPDAPSSSASTTKETGEDARCIVEYREDAVHVKGTCDHTIIPLPAALRSGLCADNDETICEQGKDLEVHDCDQQSWETQITIQICNLELLEDANVNDAVDVLDETAIDDTNLTLRDLLDASVNATLS